MDATNTRPTLVVTNTLPALVVTEIKRLNGGAIQVRAETLQADRHRASLYFDWLPIWGPAPRISEVLSTSFAVIQDDGIVLPGSVPATRDEVEGLVAEDQRRRRAAREQTEADVKVIDDGQVKDVCSEHSLTHPAARCVLPEGHKEDHKFQTISDLSPYYAGASVATRPACDKCLGEGVIGGAPDFPGDQRPVTMTFCDCPVGQDACREAQAEYLCGWFPVGATPPNPCVRPKGHAGHCNALSSSPVILSEGETR